MNVDTFIKAAENGDLQKVKEYRGDVDTKNKVSSSNE
jgi:hypothetical protein